MSLKTTVALFFAAFTIAPKLNGQTLVTGIIQDTSSHSRIPNASVVLLRAKDSIMQAFCVTANDGSFSLPDIDTGRAVILIAYPGYADYTDFIQIKDKLLDLGRLSLTNKVAVLQEVVVRGVVSAIKLKGDTTEYTADSFRVQPNATVEELLKQLPGLQVDRDGKITAQGETVKKVLVDGEEFFGDDPTIVTRNLRADMVDKVQVYDKKSDQAAFSGIDDGIKDKTVNLQLKKDRQKGWFGKLELGAGSMGYYEHQAMINLFREKERLSAYGTFANTGRVGLPWQDNNAYAGGTDQSATKDVDLDSWDGNYDGRGVPVAKTGGLHYNDSWNSDRVSVNANYKVSDLGISGSDNSIVQNNLPGNIYISNNGQVFQNRLLKNKLQTSLVIKLDPSSILKIDLAGLLSHKITDNRYTDETRNADSALLNRGNRQLNDNAHGKTFDGNILWEKKLDKKGRTLSLDLKGNSSNNKVLGYLFSMDSFFLSGGAPDSASLIDQMKDNKGSTSMLDAKVIYTEPLSARVSLLLNYEAIAGRSSSTIRSYDQSTGGSFDSLNSLYSNDYHYNRMTHKIGPAISVSSGKWRAFAGNDLGFTGFKQDNVEQQAVFSRSFINWYPSASINYLFSLQRQLGISYEGNTIQPLVGQLQPILNNYDPLNIFIGNQLLDPVYTSLISAHYNFYNPMSRHYVFSNVNYLFSGNQITTSTVTEPTGISSYQYINRKGYAKYWGYLGYGGRITKWDGSWGFNLSLNGNMGENLTNGVSNKLTTTASGLEAYIGMEKKNEYALELKAGAAYNTNSSSLQPQSPENYWVSHISPSAEFDLPDRIKIHSDVNYTITQKTPAFNSNLNVFLLNAWIGKYCLKKDALLIRLVVNDLLDQNKGVTRNLADNLITQNAYSTVRRFFLFSVVWNFSSIGKQPMPQQ